MEAGHCGAPPPNAANAANASAPSASPLDANSEAVTAEAAAADAAAALSPWERTLVELPASSHLSCNVHTWLDVATDTCPDALLAYLPCRNGRSDYHRAP